MIIITGAITATVETLAALIDVCVAHSERSRAGPGCIAHNVHIDCENPLRLFFHEQWTDMDAVRAHFREPDSIEFVRTLRRIGAETTGAQVFESSVVDV
jgi:quinol monooxygenase YgiN